MKTIRRLNIFLLIIAIIFSVVFVVKQSNEEKYGDYDKKIAVVFNDIESSSTYLYTTTKIFFTITNNGKADVSDLVLDMRITSASDSSKSYECSVRCNFNYYLTSNNSEKRVYSFNLYSDDYWLAGKNKSELNFAYRIKSVYFKEGNTYENNNSQFVGGSQGNNNSQNQHTHTYNTLKHNETQHWYECSCGAFETKESHSGGSATCEELAQCSVCNTEYGSLANHTYTTIKHNETQHWYECSCGAIEYSEHTIDSSGFCSSCELPMSATEGLIIDVSGDGAYAEVIGYSGSSTKVNIPLIYNNLPVKTIYDEAFKDTNITKVVIPSSVTSIGYRAFYNCDSLTSVTIPDSVTSIGFYAFEYCSSLTSIDFGENSRLTSIGFYAFEYCSSLTSIEIPESVTSIGDRAFSGCNSALYTTENNLTYVKANGNPYFLLMGATNKNFTTYVINSQTKHIGYGVFADCTRLARIVIPDSVTSIGSSAFAYCDSLTNVTIGDSVTSIGERAFYDCDSLTIYCEAESTPSGWDGWWNSSRPVVWGYKG